MMIGERSPDEEEEEEEAISRYFKFIFKLFQFTSKYFNLPINFGIFSISTIIKYIGVVPQLSSAKMNHRGTSCTHYHDWLGYHEL